LQELHALTTTPNLLQMADVCTDVPAEPKKIQGAFIDRGK